VEAERSLYGLYGGYSTSDVNLLIQLGLPCLPCLRTDLKELSGP
jgi:hypothetical protein